METDQNREVDKLKAEIRHRERAIYWLLSHIYEDEDSNDYPCPYHAGYFDQTKRCPYHTKKHKHVPDSASFERWYKIVFTNGFYLYYEIDCGTNRHTCWFHAAMENTAEHANKDAANEREV